MHGTAPRYLQSCVTLVTDMKSRQRLQSSSITWLCRMSVSVQSASGHSRFLVLQCGTIFHLTSHQRRHSWFSHSASIRSCSLSLIRTFISDSHSLLLSLPLCGPSNNWHYLVHTKALGLITSKWLKIDLSCMRQKCCPQDLVFSDISLMAIFAEVTENECTLSRGTCTI